MNWRNFSLNFLIPNRRILLLKIDIAILFISRKAHLQWKGQL